MLPRVLYGTDVIHVNKPALEKLERAQRMFIKNVFHLPNSTADAACYAVAGIQPIQNYIWKYKMSYYQYVSSREESRWVFQAYKQQEKWALYEGLIQQDGTIVPTGDSDTAPTYWLKNVIHAYKSLGHTMMVPQSKVDIKLLLGTVHRDYLSSEAKRTTLKYMDNLQDEPDYEYNSRWQSWWLKLRTGGLYLGFKKDDLNTCPLCSDQVETMEHFLVGCSHYQTEYPFADDQLKGIAWALSSERTMEERKMVNQCISGRWKERTKQLEQVSTDSE